MNSTRLSRSHILDKSEEQSPAQPLGLVGPTFRMPDVSHFNQLLHHYSPSLMLSTSPDAFLVLMGVCGRKAGYYKRVYLMRTQRMLAQKEIRFAQVLQLKFNRSL